MLPVQLTSTKVEKFKRPKISKCTKFEKEIKTKMNKLSKYMINDDYFKIKYFSFSLKSSPFENDNSILYIGFTISVPNLNKILESWQTMHLKELPAGFKNDSTAWTIFTLNEMLNPKLKENLNEEIPML
ncbi:hypothetical protein [Spiroplasma endosymbiont of Labia minor]|uniref:hypothetical protein n=1 Tax=Spiroplasma endosymbiont of Labia minor TaxID=3066305 RepID=UPI0030CFB47A